MVTLNQSELKHLAKHYYFANTPSYLYRKLREEPIVKRCSEKYTFHEIVEEIKRLIAEDNKSINNLIKAYVLLISLTYYNDTHMINKLLENRTFDKLDWWDSMLNLWKDKTIPAKIVILQSAKKAPNLVHPNKQSNTQVHSVKFGGNTND